MKYRLPLKDINVIWNGVTNGRLHVEGLKIDPGTPQEAAQVERWCIIFLAGKIAEKKHNLSSLWLFHGISDVQRVFDALFKLNRFDDMELYKEMESRTSDFVETHWPVIERLAKLLIERLSLTGEEATAEIMRPGQRRQRGLRRSMS